MDLVALVQQCAPAVEQSLALRLMRRESAFNPFAIGVDSGGAPVIPQPKTLQAAVAVAESLISERRKFSVGIAQIHIDNIRAYKLTWRQAFDPCTNLKKGQSILEAFHAQALRAGFAGDDAVLAALRGYNSGNLYATVSQGYATEILGVRNASAHNAERSTAEFQAKRRDTRSHDGQHSATDDGQSKDVFGE